MSSEEGEDKKVVGGENNGSVEVKVEDAETVKKSITDKLKEIVKSIDLQHTTINMIKKRLGEELKLTESLLEEHGEFISQSILSLLNPEENAEEDEPKSKESADKKKQEQEEEDREFALQLQDAFNEGRPKRRAAAKVAPTKKKPKRSTKVKEEEEGEEGGEATKKPKKERPKKLVSLSPALSEFMGTAYSQRGEVVKRIWQHIKANDLQDPKDKRNILLDATLKKIFGENRKAVNMFKMNKFLSNQMKPPELLA